MNNQPRADIVLAYRHLYKNALRATHFSSPARYAIRDRLRLAFRKGKTRDFDAKRVQNTVTFLQLAREPRSLEKRVLRSLLFTWWYQDQNRQRVLLIHQRADHNKSERDVTKEELTRSSYDQFNHLLKMLNESMGLCLR